MLRRSRIGGAAFCLNCRGKKSNWGKLRGKTHCGEVQSQLFLAELEIIERKRTGNSTFPVFFFGSGRRIRTLTYGVRVRCATITQSRYVRLTNICYYTSGFAFVKNYLPIFRIFFIWTMRAVFGLRFNGKAARTARAGRGFRAGRGPRPAGKSCGWWETGARLGCFGGRKIGKFYGFGENADSLLRFKLLYCIHQSFREEHRP